MRRTLLIVVVLLGGTGAGAAQERITQADLLRRLVALDWLTRPPVGERSGLFSGHGQAGVEAGLVHEESDGWRVAAEIPGAGALTRIWSANPEGKVRFVFDKRSMIEVEFADLFSGDTPPFEEPLCYGTETGGCNCYFPIGFSQSCQVLLSDAAASYQINYVTFAPGTQVQTFSRQLDQAAQDARDEVYMAFLTGLSDRQLVGDGNPYSLSRFAELAAGESASIETFGGGGVIRALYVALTDRVLPPEPYTLHECILRIYFDGQEQAGVEAPLIDFFGAGFDMSRYNSLLCGTDKWTTMPGQGMRDGVPRVTEESHFMYCYFPMPFADVARLEIAAAPGLSKRKRLGVMLYARVERETPPADALRFYARFHKEDPCGGREYTILETHGCGRIVGCVLNVDCPRRDWWGVGAEKLWIDGGAAAAYVGTDSAGFLGDAGRLDLRAKPLHGATWRGDFGKNSGYRWLINDCIDFQQSVRFVLESLQAGGAQDTYYGTLVYWYGPLDAGAEFPALTSEALAVPGLRIPGAVEVEGRVRGTGWGTLLKQKYADGDELSGGLAAVITTDQPVQVSIPATAERRVRLGLRVHQRGTRFFKTIEVRDAAGELVGTVEYDRQSEGLYAVGTARLLAGDNLFTVRCSKKTVLDCWILEDVVEAAPTSQPSAP